MADWLKLNHALVRSAKVRGLMRLLRCKKHAALGLAVNWLCWIDEQTVDGRTGLLPDELDDEIGFRGGAEALIGIGWAALGEDGCVYALEFGKHCGASAKERAENARRSAKCKAKKKKVMDEVMEECYQGNENSLPKGLPEKNRIEFMDKDMLRGNTTVDVGAGAVPLPGSAEEVRVLMAGTASCALDGRELVACATAFFEESVAVGWVLRGQPVRDWRATARAFMTRWQNNLRSGGRPGRGRKGGENNGLGSLNKNIYG